MTVSEIPRPFSIRELSAGRTIKITATDDECTALAARLQIPAVARFTATINLSNWHGRKGVHIEGTVNATLTQNCVVSLTDFSSDVTGEFDELFVFNARDAQSDDPEDPNVPTLWEEDQLDLGGLAAEYLALEMEPFPKRPDAEFHMPQTGSNQPRPSEDDVPPSPFAALKALKNPQGNDEGSGESGA